MAQTYSLQVLIWYDAADTEQCERVAGASAGPLMLVNDMHQILCEHCQDCVMPPPFTVPKFDGNNTYCCSVALLTMWAIHKGQSRTRFQKLPCCCSDKGVRLS
jgi:hypothetical protein